MHEARLGIRKNLFIPEGELNILKEMVSLGMADNVSAAIHVCIDATKGQVERKKAELHAMQK